VSPDRYSSITISCIQTINHETLNIEIRSYLLASQPGDRHERLRGVPRDEARDAAQMDEHMHKRANVYKPSDCSYT